MNESKLARANRGQPCPVCLKTDWCLIGKDMAICMRVHSQHKHTFVNHAVGWIHRLKEPLPNYQPPKTEPRPTLKVKEILSELGGQNVSHLAKALGVSCESLTALGCVWSPKHKAWAFPMRGGDGSYAGIRLRSIDGKKWAVTGSREGVFYTFGNPNDTTLFVVEGPTDCAAAMTLGLDCVGRPSCYGGIDEIRTIVRNQKYKRVVIIGDNDSKPSAREATTRGLKSLSDAMFVPRCIITLPCKDIRQFLNDGGERGVIDYLVKNTVWTVPQRMK